MRRNYLNPYGWTDSQMRHNAIFPIYLITVFFISAIFILRKTENIDLLEVLPILFFGGLPYPHIVIDDMQNSSYPYRVSVIQTVVQGANYVKTYVSITKFVQIQKVS